MRVGIIGAGKWGLALYSAFSLKNECVITSRTKKEIPNYTTLKDVLQSKLIVICLSAQSISSWLDENFLKLDENDDKHEKFKFEKDQKLLIASKGIDAKSGKFLSEIFEEYVEKRNLAYLSGPSFATEVLKKLPCAVVVSSSSSKTSNSFLELFPDYMKAYVSDDIIGSEICGAYKNVIAIASGICDGLNLGNNARASLMARGLVEMDRFGKVFGAKNETFLGLSGAGDLFLTASSVLSRNYRVGLGLAKGKKLSEILSDLGEVAEGVLTSKAIVKIAIGKDIYTPIASEISSILDGKDVKKSLADLLKRNKIAH